ncbi:hypothetical protein [Yinghuangia soli]|nr:hypothetical protein [Yinghuangia soli]
MTAEVLAAAKKRGPGQIELAVLWINIEAGRQPDRFGGARPDGGG